MADQRRHEDMYCHTCHHEWRREGDVIGCPACGCTSTEIIDSQQDPRVFHNRQPIAVDSDPLPAPRVSETTSTSTASTPPSQPGLAAANSSSTTQHTRGSTPDSQGPRPAVAGTQVPPVTFISFHIPLSFTPQGSHAPPQTPPEVFARQIFPLIVTFSSHPPTMNTSSTPQAAHTQGREQTNTQHSETPRSEIHAREPSPTGPLDWIRGFLLRQALRVRTDDPTSPFSNFARLPHTQQALEQIIEELIQEQTLQEATGGAPPASQSAIDRLQTKELDDKMLGVCSQCTICVDDLAKGEKVAVLPCDHFFHGECVMPWLKRHNTCPMCRRSVEVERDEGKNVKGAGASTGAPAAPQPETNNGASDAMDCS